MADAATVQFTDSNFQTEAMQANLPVLVDFWAEWCGPCRKLSPIIDELATEYVGKIKIGKVDVDSNQKIALQFGIQSIPTVVLLKSGQIVKKWVGIPAKTALTEALDNA